MKHHLVRFRLRARRDLIALYEYLSRRFSEDASFRFIQRIESASEALATAPLRGRIVAGGSPGLRVIGFERRVSILFRVHENSVEILRVLYGGQTIES